MVWRNACAEVENLEQYLRFSLRREWSQPTVRFPSLEYQCWEQEPTQHLAVKIIGDSLCPDKRKAARNPDIFLKVNHTKSCLQALTLGSSGGMAGHRMPESQREKMCCVASGISKRTATNVSVSSPSPTLSQMPFSLGHALNPRGATLAQP